MSFQGKRDTNTRTRSINLEAITHEANGIKNTASARKSEHHTHIEA